VHGGARTPCGVEIRTHRRAKTPSLSASSDNMGRCHKPQCKESQADAR
jgi:hypothetical protein